MEPEKKGYVPPTTGKGSLLPGMKLTEKQQITYDLKKEGKTVEEIAAIRGISRSVVSKTLTITYKKLGISCGYEGGKVMPNPMATEFRNPEMAAAIIEAGTDPLEKVAVALRDAGLPEGTSQSVLKRLRQKYYGAVFAVRELQTNEITRIVNEKIHLLSHYLDDKVAAEANARDLAMAMTQLIEKRALLRGEPTQIISNLERQKLNELTPLLIAEAKRRGIVIEGKVEEKVIS